MCLNQTAALVWKYCDGKGDISEITGKLEKELGASVNEELVLFAVSELNEKGLIENGEGISDGFEGLSRREIVKKIGFASMVALPIISSIVAPKASFAQTQGLCVTNPGVEFVCTRRTLDECCTDCCRPRGFRGGACRILNGLRCTCTCR